jgi:predicted RNase H-like HicB family nuclease
MSEAARAWLVSVVVEPNDDGFLATCPGIQGALAEGDTIEEAIFNCIDVIKMIGEYRAERGESPR